MTKSIPLGALALGLVWGGVALATEAEPAEVPTLALAAAQEVQEIDPCDPRLMQPGDVDEYSDWEVSEKKGGVNDGVYVLLGGGIDGYTGDLNHDLDIGPAWGGTVGLTTKRIGVEATYSGAANEIDTPGDLDVGGGVDVVRNGGHAAVKINVLDTALHPYVLGGIGIEDRNVRNGQALGFNDDSNGYIPAAAGLRWNLGAFTADARLSYNFMFEDDFAPGDPSGDRYQGTIMLGGTL